VPEDDVEFERELSALMHREAAGRVSPSRIEALALRGVPSRPAVRGLRRAAVVAWVSVACAGIVLALVIGAGRPASRPPAGTPTSAPPTTVAAPPRQVTSRMPGLVQVVAAAYPTPAHGVLLIQQCYPCHAKSGTLTTWVAVTDDGGGSWTVRTTDLSDQGAGGFGLSFADATNGWANGGWVTHDGGLSWRKARAATSGTVDRVAVAGGTVWALADGCSGTGCWTVVLSGAATGSDLTPVPSQPASVLSPGSVLAVGEGAAFVDGYGPRGEVAFGTSDGGRSWRALPPHCPAGTFKAPLLAADSPSSLWAFCQEGTSVTTPTGTVVKARPAGQELLARSTDGGATWTTTPVSVSAGQLAPVNQQVAWLWPGLDTLWRTGDGGGSWSTVWSTNTVPLPAPGDAQPGAFSAESPSEAEIAVAVSSSVGTYVVVDQTLDGGASWQAATVSLPGS
jgi:hypothetical protein